MRGAAGHAGAGADVTGGPGRAGQPIRLGNAVREYDAFLEPIAERLRAGASEEELTSFLETVVRDHLGLEPNHEREAALARELIDWYSGSEGSRT